jgi:hypothetical protein
VVGKAILGLIFLLIAGYLLLNLAGLVWLG